MAPEEITKDCVTSVEAAKMLGWSVGYLYNKVAKGTGPDNFKYGKRTYFKIKDVEAFRRSLVQVRRYR